MMSLKKWVVLSAAGSALLLAGCQNAKADNTNAAGATWSRMEKDNITSMDPSKAVDGISAQAITDTMEGLYRYGGTDLQPGLAKSIVKPTHQGTVYTFKLRSAKWSNGDPVTAQDFVYGWRRTDRSENEVSIHLFVHGNQERGCHYGRQEKAGDAGCEGPGSAHFSSDIGPSDSVFQYHAG